MIVKNEWAPGNKYYDATYRIGFDFYCDISNRVIRSRKRLGLTQKQLSEKAGIKSSRLQQLEGMRLRWQLEDCEKVAAALGESVDYVIGAEIDSVIGDCLYTVAPESAPEYGLYQKATSPQMAFMKMFERFRTKGRGFVGATERAYVVLVGVPITQKEIDAKFPSAPSKDEDYIANT